MTSNELDASRSDKIQAMLSAILISLRHLLGWLVSAFSSREDLILENLALRASSCWLCTPNDLAIDSLRCTSCSGWCCEGSGLDGKSLSSWSHRERLLVGIGLAFGCIGNGSPEPDSGEAESV
jgi:hypothetical protein